VYASDTTAKNSVSKEPGADLKIEDISIKQSDFIYSDASIPMTIEAMGINYKGKSDIVKDILKLQSDVQINSLKVIYNSVAYIENIPVKGNLATTINLNSMQMTFQKNDLMIHDIPFKFIGQFLLRNDGYDFYLSLDSKYKNESLHTMLRLIGTNKLWVVARIGANLNLENWAEGLGIKKMELKGKLLFNLDADGIYFSGQNPASKKPDTVILSIPDFTLKSSLSNGYLKYPGCPKPITGISFEINAACDSNNYRNITATIENFNANVLESRLKGYFKITKFQDLPVEGKLSTNIDLATLHEVLPIDSIDLAGKLSLDLDVKGNYSPEKKLFPVTTLSLKLSEGVLKTKYYPHPVEKITIDAKVTNQTGKIEDTRVMINPFTFIFEGKPMTITANVSNPDNINYDITSRGSVDLGKIYKVFSQEGMDLNGYIGTDLKLKGSQSDALAGNYQKLSNSGSLELHDISYSSEYLLHPFVIKKGLFKFENDKIRFEKFEGHYIASDITLDGYLNNVVNYILSNQKLKGSFTLTSDYLLVDEFMVPGKKVENGGWKMKDGGKTMDSKSEQRAASSEQPTTGVVMIPENLEVGLKANAKKISYKKLEINDFSAAVEVKQGMLLLKGMNLDLIGCKVKMDATYGSINPSRAFFDFHLQALDFDIKRAYNEVDLFRNLSTSAGKCEGIVSLDYSLKGKLDAGMNPVLPSLEGGGTLTLKKIKVMGLNLFTAMSKNLEREKLKDPDLSKVELKTTIKNNVIKLEKTKMKISGFRFRIGGESNFNGAMNFKARLGLPPMGIVGIPMRILGTMDSPKFKYGRGSGDEDVESTNYTDEIPKEMLSKIKSAKEEDLKDDSDK
ncbi:MAG: AsmA-like C-terminal region-containing protein, partial [Bacteroidota bacterium]